MVADRPRAIDPQRLIRTAERLDRASDPVISRLLLEAAITPDDTLAADIATMLDTLDVVHAQYPFNAEESVPAPETGLELGQVVGSTSRFTLAPDRLSNHVAIYGQSGMGKTTLITRLLQQLDGGWWVLDRKQDYRQLIRDPGTRVTVIPWERLRLNPLRPPPGVPIDIWTELFGEVFGHATGLLSASKNRIKTDLVRLYDRHGFEVHPNRYSLDTVLAGETAVARWEPPKDARFPTLAELRDAVADGGSGHYRDQQYETTIRNRLDAFNTVLGPVFDTRDGLPLVELLDEHVVFELELLGRDAQNFIMEYLLLYAYTYRLVNNERGTSPRFTVTVDEAKRLFSRYKEKQDAAGEPLVNDLTEKVRAFNIGLVLAAQEPQKLTRTVRTNTYTSVLFPLGDGSEFQSVADSMALSDRQRRFAADQLGVGQAVVRVGQRRPVPVRFDNVDLGVTVTDTDLARSQRTRWQQLSDSVDTLTSERPKAATQDRTSQQQSVSGRESGTGESEIDTDHEDLLADIVVRPFAKLKTRYEEFSSAGKGNRVKNDLIETGLIREHWVEDGGRFKLLELTEDGRQYLRRETDLDVRRDWRGNIVHGYWQHRLKAIFEAAGYEAELEQADADVSIALGEDRIAVEVAMEAADREVQHVRDRLAGEFDGVWVVCRSEVVEDRLRSMLAETDIDMDAVRLHRFQAVTAELVSETL